MHQHTVLLETTIEAIEDNTMADANIKTPQFHSLHQFKQLTPTNTISLQEAVSANIRKNFLTKNKNTAKTAANIKIENELAKHKANPQDTTSDEYKRFDYSEPIGDPLGVQIINAITR